MPSDVLPRSRSSPSSREWHQLQVALAINMAGRHDQASFAAFGKHISAVNDGLSKFAGLLHTITSAVTSAGHGITSPQRVPGP
jgi:hypothetical protein